jgi:hypothetical protein
VHTSQRTCTYIVWQTVGLPHTGLQTHQQGVRGGIEQRTALLLRCAAALRSLAGLCLATP